MGDSYKWKIDYSYEKLWYGSIIGSTVKPSQFDVNVMGIALTALTKFHQKTAHYLDFD